MMQVCALLLVVVVVVVTGALANPVTQPVYTGQQHAQYQAPPPQIQYYQPAPPPSYLVQGAGGQAHPVFEQAPDLGQALQYRPQQPLAQPLLSHTDRQIQKAAKHLAGPDYVQQIQALQLQGQAEQAQAQVQRNALRLATAPRAQPIQYQQQQQQQQRVLQQPDAPGGDLQDQYNSNPSYQFGFDVKDDVYTNYQNRKEQREGDKITGSYSVVDSDGFIRTVTYTADPKQGFKAEVTRQPTDIVVKLPQSQQQRHQQQQQQIQQQQQQQQYSIEVPQQGGAAGAQGKQPRIVYQYQ